MWRIFGILAVIAAALASIAYGIGAGWFGHERGPGEIKGAAVPAEVIAARADAQTSVRSKFNIASSKQILFGDFHVHTTYSLDAFLISLPMLQGEGAHPPADACDYARYCSALDFWSINDHVEGMTNRQWKATAESIRACNAQAGDQKNPDLVSFLGWEWTQAGSTPENHYGHKNVIMRDIEKDRVPVRPIASAAPESATLNLRRLGPSFRNRLNMGVFAPEGHRQEYLDFAKFIAERNANPDCPDGVPVRDLPAICNETARTPDVLFKKLRDWNYPALVIPHGTTWGFYTPRGATFDKQLKGANHDPRFQRLFEVFSGHGNSEEYRDYREVIFNADGMQTCPAPSATHLPGCWRAGEIIRKRCLDAKETAGECERRAVEARALYLKHGQAGFLTVTGQTIQDWQDAGQCRDCFLPSFNYRPGNSAQYALAMTNFDSGSPRRFEFGFMASSDNHFARPGTGYKEINRMANVEGGGGPMPGGALDADNWRGEPAPRAVDFDPKQMTLSPFQLMEAERQASFFMSGGLVAVHSQGRDRGAVWDALQRREVFATSGDRMMLWFDLENAPAATDGGPMQPMGAIVKMGETPRFTVKAAGAFKQKLGCPDLSIARLGQERLQRLCQGECYNPSAERKLITRIEVVRIRPQSVKGEAMAPLIQDVWKRHDCPPDQAGCTFTFEDEDFTQGNRDTTYYVRAIEEPSQALNGGHLRCERDAEGQCIKVKPCFKDFRTDNKDDCLAPVEERAWSSPIYLHHDKGLMAQSAGLGRAP